MSHRLGLYVSLSVLFAMLMNTSTLSISSCSWTQFSSDLSEIQSLGVNNYFNLNGSCNIPSNPNDVTTVNINSVSDLLQIVNIRKRYPPNQLVYFLLTAVDTYGSDGSLIPAYLLTSPLEWNANMSCSYIHGMGMNLTSVLVDFTQYYTIQTTTSAITVTSVSDFIITDLMLDRTSPSWQDPGYTCLMATYYPSLVQNHSVIANTPNCLYQVKNAGIQSIVFTMVERTHIFRIKTLGGISLVQSKNSTISSSVVNSLSNSIVVMGSTSGEQHSMTFTPNPGIIVYNNTVTGIFGTCIYINPIGVWAHHNYAYDCGYSPIVLGWTGGALVEYNYGFNFSFFPGAGGGSAGVYIYGGWAVWGHVVRYNWFYAPNQKCFYIDGISSNILWEYNVCYVSSNELNGGRFNVFRSNLFLAIGVNAHYGDINCPLLDDPNLTPLMWYSCNNVIQHTATTGYVRNMPWENYQVIKGIAYKVANISNSDAFIINQTPQKDFNIWCAPTTAGPNNMTCATPKTTYYSNKTAYPFPCEILPTNNQFGNKAFVGFTAIYNKSPINPWNPGFGCGPCNVSANQVGGCPIPGPQGWAPWTYDASWVPLALNFFNNTSYNWMAYNQTSPSKLFGVYLPIGSAGFLLTPKTFNITPNSQLAMDNPDLLNIPFSQIGLMPYSPFACSDYQGGNGAGSWMVVVMVAVISAALSWTL